MEPYVHQTQGRIRVRSLYIQYNPKNVAKSLQQLKAIPGITDVQHRLYAGSVTILYDHRELSPDFIMDIIHKNGWLKEQAKLKVNESQVLNQFMQRGAKTLIKNIAMHSLKGTFAGTLVSVALSMKS